MFRLSIAESLDASRSLELWGELVEVIANSINAVRASSISLAFAEDGSVGITNSLTNSIKIIKDLALGAWAELWECSAEWLSAFNPVMSALASLVFATRCSSGC